MEKQLTRSAMFYSIGFIFMLVCAVGAFFYGVQYGSEQTKTSYEMKQLNSEAKSKSTPLSAARSRLLLSYCISALP